MLAISQDPEIFIVIPAGLRFLYLPTHALNVRMGLA
jgi:hypothetical protein